MKRIPKQVVILSLISLFTDMASEMLYPITPIFLSSVLGASMVVVGDKSKIEEGIKSLGYDIFYADADGNVIP